MDFYNEEIPAFGIAGNFTGHLEQAGEADSFASICTPQSAPKAVFPTFIPPKKGEAGAVPDFLHTFPFSAKSIVLPAGKENVQAEPECALLCTLEWTEEGYVKNIVPRSFAASNDCSLRKEGVTKISLKKNWGAKTKGLSRNFISIDDFSPSGNLDRYRIASFLRREGKCIPYGEDSPIRTYSYIYDKLILWLTEKLNFQKNEGPCEDIHSYLLFCSKPASCLISIGSTRYTSFGEHNFLLPNDESIVMLYPQDRYSFDKVLDLASNASSIPLPQDISFLCQKVKTFGH